MLLGPAWDIFFRAALHAKWITHCYPRLEKYIKYINNSCLLLCDRFPSSWFIFGYSLNLFFLEECKRINSRNNLGVLCSISSRLVGVYNSGGVLFFFFSSPVDVFLYRFPLLCVFCLFVHLCCFCWLVVLFGFGLFLCVCVTFEWSNHNLMLVYMSNWECIYGSQVSYPS